MGEPATPSPAERAATLADALAIVESVRNDEPMPAPFSTSSAAAVVMLLSEWDALGQFQEIQDGVFRLAQDLCDTRAALEQACDALEYVAKHWPREEFGDLADRLRRLDLEGGREAPLRRR